MKLVRKKFIRDTFGNPIGCMIAIDFDGVVGCGWSLCCRNDQFSKSRATQIAEGRAAASIRGKSKKVHTSIEDHFEEFVNNVEEHLDNDQVLYYPASLSTLSLS